MRPDLAQRLQKVAKKLVLLKKLALSEGEFIDRASKRSLMALQKYMGKLEEALVRLSPNRKANETVVALIEAVISPSGVVNQEAIASKKPFDAMKAMQKVAPALTGAVGHLMSSATIAGKMQNADRVELAKMDPKHKDFFFRAQEKFTSSLQQMDEALREVKFPEQPTAPTPEEAPKDSSGVEALGNQIDEAHQDMLGVVQAMAKAILNKVEDLFPNDTLLKNALEQNLIAAMPGAEPGRGRKVNEKLNRDKDFYKDVLELQRGSDYDLGQFLDSKNKKLVYQAYRSMIMAVRALGFMQWAKARPDVVAANSKILKLVVKAQQILQKRKSLVINRLNKLQEEDDPEEEDRGSDERGVPKGTFQNYFEDKKAPRGVFDSAA